MANKEVTSTKCTCPGGGRIDPTCPIHGTGSAIISPTAATGTTTDSDSESTTNTVS